MKKFIPFLFLSIAGCEHTPIENYKNMLNIYAVLIPDQPQQWIKVDRTYTMDEQSSEEIDDALVILRSKHSIDTLVLVDSGRYQSRDSILINPTDTFYFSVNAPGLDSVYGTTIVPDSVIILHPGDNDTADVSDSLVIKVRTNSHYALFCPGFPYMPSWWFSSNSDTLWVIPLSQLGVAEGTHTYEMQIISYDKNFVEYCMYQKPNGGVIGGLGVFGSIIMKNFSLYIKK